MTSRQHSGTSAPERIVRRLGPIAGGVLLLPVVVVALPLWLVAALTRWLSRQPLLEPRAFPQDLVEYLPVIGARTRPNLDTYGKGEDVFRLTTDADGWRGQATLDEADVAVFGDSFAFGYGVDDVDFYADLIPGLNVKAVASPAYSMVHEVLWMGRLARRLRGKTVAWLIYWGNDLSDNLRPNLGSYRMPFVRGRPGGPWEIVTDHVSDEPWTLQSRPRDNDKLVVEYCTPSWEGERVFSAADFLIGEAARICGDAGACLAVVTIPLTTRVKDPASLRRLSATSEQVDLALPDRRLEESCTRRAIPFIALAPRLRPRHYWHEDMHWNAAGHRLAAEVVADIHRRHGARAGGLTA